jgi:hypothetical protein
MLHGVARGFETADISDSQRYDDFFSPLPNIFVLKAYFKVQQGEQTSRKSV